MTASSPTTYHKLDVSSLPKGQIYRHGENGIDLGLLFDEKIKPIIKNMMTFGLVRDTPSFGFAMAKPDPNLASGAWDNASLLVWMTGGWGPEKDRYIANAVRKLRLAGRVGGDSLGTDESLVDSPVASVEEDGTFRWGDFPYGGAVWAGSPFIGGNSLLGAVSALTQQEDHVVVQLILDIFALEIHKLKEGSITP